MFPQNHDPSLATSLLVQVVFLQSVLNGLGDAMVCPRLGIAGAAITTLLAQAVTTLAMVVAVRTVAGWVAEGGGRLKSL